MIQRENRSAHTTGGDTYITPRWMVRFLLDHSGDIFKTASVILDPCACGINGYSIGTELGKALDIPYTLGDIEPKDPSVHLRDFKEWSEEEVPSAGICVTNPPYNLLEEFVDHWITRVERTIVLCRLGYLSTGGGAHAKSLESVLLPTKRVAFEVLPEDVYALEAGGKAVSKNQKPDSVTGWEMQTSAVDHCWAVYRRGYCGAVDLRIRRPNTNPIVICDTITDLFPF